MFTLAWPWVLLALPLALAARRWLKPYAMQDQVALRVPDFDDFQLAPTGTPETGAYTRQFWLALLAWTLLVFAAARPQWLGPATTVPVSGRDLMLAIDLSKSMEVEDFVLAGRRIDRLQAIRAVAAEFIARREGDRLALILFGTRAYLQVPLTFDRATTQQLFDEAFIGLAGDNTAIGDAIGLAVKRLREQDAEHKVLVLMTDGANTAGSIEPLRAAQLAATAGLRIYTIGIGSNQMLRRGIFGGMRINPAQELDEKTLRAIAEATGGRYFRALDIGGLREIYAELDQLEPVAHEDQHFRPLKELYPWPLGLSMFVAVALAIKSLPIMRR